MQSLLIERPRTEPTFSYRTTASAGSAAGAASKSAPGTRRPRDARFYAPSGKVETLFGFAALVALLGAVSAVVALCVDAGFGR